MTAIAGVFGVEPPAAGAAHTQRALGAMRHRGADQADHWESSGVALGASWFAWEAEATGVANGGVVRRGPLAVVADATLYYKQDLVRRIAAKGVAVTGDSAGALILAAYAAFGDACADHLEGDFAFVVFDERTARAFAARDFGGKRTLYYATPGGTLVAASTISGVLADGRVSTELNIRAIATEAACLWGNSCETCYTAITELAAGFALSWERGKGATAARFWLPPATLDPNPSSLDDGARELQALLTDATRERLAPAGPTSVSLSGGWDSTAVFGAGQNALRGAAAAGRTITPISISYPEGDPGREDELISDTVAFWKTSTSWIDIKDIPLFGDPAAEARVRDEPWAHAFERWNRALSQRARGAGARVILDGSGGDQLFQVSDIFLADLFGGGRWVELARQWRTRSGRSLRGFWRWAVRPALAERMLAFLARLRGMGAPRHYLDRLPSAWFRHSFLRDKGVFDQEQASRPPLPRSSAVLAETHVYLLYSYFARVAGRLFSFALSEGVELRSPLLDARVVRFAARRPWYERVHGRETKVLLRRSMRGLLPDTLLAPRTHRTGLTSGYFTRSLMGPGRPLVESLIAESRLASMGMVNPATLRRAWDYFLKEKDDELGVRIFLTLQAELWLRAHDGGASA